MLHQSRGQAVDEPAAATAQHGLPTPLLAAAAGPSRGEAAASAPGACPAPTQAPSCMVQQTQELQHTAGSLASNKQKVPRGSCCGWCHSLSWKQHWMPLGAGPSVLMGASPALGRHTITLMVLFAHHPNAVRLPLPLRAQGGTALRQSDARVRQLAAQLQAAAAALDRLVAAHPLTVQRPGRAAAVLAEFEAEGLQAALDDGAAPVPSTPRACDRRCSAPSSSSGGGGGSIQRRLAAALDAQAALEARGRAAAARAVACAAAQACLAAAARCLCLAAEELQSAGLRGERGSGLEGALVADNACWCCVAVSRAGHDDYACFACRLMLALARAPAPGRPPPPPPPPPLHPPTHPPKKRSLPCRCRGCAFEQQRASV